MPRVEAEIGTFSVVGGRWTGTNAAIVAWLNTQDLGRDDVRRVFEAADIFDGTVSNLPPHNDVRVEGRALGDLPGHPFHGNQWTEVAGDDESAQRELKTQRERADAQDNPLAHPDFVMGMPDLLGVREGTVALRRYVAAYGEEHRAAPLPADVERGTPKECYRNASLLVMSHPELDYAEGFAKSSKTGDLTFLHAWGVTKDGRVVDPTWDEPEKGQYFGVRYARMPYLNYLYKAKLYGVLGSTDENVMRAITTGGHGLRRTS